MTNEEIRKVMEFIIKQQESFSEGLEQMREMQAKAEARVGRLEGAFVNLFNVVTELGKAQKTLTETVTQLAEAQAHTDQRVNVLIDILERGRDGGSKA
jgi:ABC-type transporter Mla subunit MlaD